MDSSKSTINYTKLNEKLEFVSKSAYLLLLYTSFGACGLCAIILSYINYYIFDLGDDSFLAPTPLMYDVFHIIRSLI